MRIDSVSAHAMTMPSALRSRSVGAPNSAATNADEAATLTHDSNTRAPRGSSNVEDARGPKKSPHAEGMHGHGPRGRGVLRLLEAGHFKGVADVRLRINFHDELEARAAERGREALGGATDALIDSVAGGVSSLVEAQSAQQQGTDDTQQ